MTTAMIRDQNSPAAAEDPHGRTDGDGDGRGRGSGSDTCGNAPAMRFDILRPSPGSSRGSSSAVVGPRLGRLVFPGRAPIPTPNFLASTSRGCVPHLTPDNVLRHTSLGGGFFALEDFIERRSDHPIYSVPAPPPSCAAAATPLHAFAAFPPSLPTFLAPRRCPPVASPSGNGHDHVSVYTSTGFRPLTVASYARAARALRPDAIVALADVGVAPGASPKRLLRAVERTEEWVGRLLTELEEGGEGGERPDGGDSGSTSTSTSSSGRAAPAPAVFVPLPAVPYPLQWEYMTNLADDLAGRISGLALYDASLAPELVNHERLLGLPRLSLEAAASPHQILHQLSLGTDLVTASLVNVSSDAGVAFRFVFPAPESDPKSGHALPLGVDMWSPEHSVSLEPLLDGCGCYACASHHRAYVHHLLGAKEMLGWILLQIHNLHVTTNFFAAVRAALAEGEEGAGVFEAECGRFAQAYEPEMPVGTGTRPRARGYHFKSEADQMPLNRPAWSKYEPAPARGEKSVVIGQK